MSTTGILQICFALNFIAFDVMMFYDIPQVCTILAEMWCLFRMTNFSSTKLSRLGYCPDIPVLQKFWKLCEQQLNISGKFSLFVL